jgi:hypothetical protein
MKKQTALLLALPLVFFLSASQAEFSEDLAEHQVSALERAGVPLYPGSVYLTGDDGDATVMWFSSDDSPDDIMDWYKEQLSDWSELAWNDIRAIYKGPPGIETSELMAWPYIFAIAKDEGGVEPDIEITIRIPNEGD